MDKIRELIASVQDFPKPGILFRDFTPVLSDPEGLKLMVDTLAERYADQGITQFVGIESRGFILASAVAYKLGAGLVLVRKPGKLPRETYSASYALEYGEDTLEIHRDALGKDDRVVIMDDLIATGGTAEATCKLVAECGALVHEVSVLIELAFLNGRDKLGGIPLHPLVTY